MGSKGYWLAGQQRLLATIQGSANGQPETVSCALRNQAALVRSCLRLRGH